MEAIRAIYRRENKISSKRKKKAETKLGKLFAENDELKTIFLNCVPINLRPACEKCGLICDNEQILKEHAKTCTTNVSQFIPIENVEPVLAIVKSEPFSQSPITKDESFDLIPIVNGHTLAHYFPPKKTRKYTPEELKKLRKKRLVQRLAEKRKKAVYEYTLKHGRKQAVKYFNMKVNAVKSMLYRYRKTLIKSQ